ncbi:MAG: DUF2207 domain-containing protein [Rehaibacterium terrae]|uniref:DUF2207 domain-containing protein n=1 Tax=Rehaibacterium terrae TaxID=1341696 RepID=UPI00391C6CAF
MSPWPILLALLCALPVAAQERILSFHSDIRIQPDGAMEVSETIVVRAEGRNIRRGIYRDFPTRYRDRFGNRVVVDFEPLEVLRDGRPEPWFTERLGNGVRLNTGSDEFLPVPADITYTLRYRTTRQLGFFAGHDELYWNVNGNGWDLAIERLSAEVRLPVAVPAAQLDAEAYTGGNRARGRDYVVEVGDGVARWRATRPLGAREGLTLVLAFPKGVVSAPARSQRLYWLLYDNRGVLVALAGFVLLLAFYLWRWHHHGRDPAPGPVFPQYAPPEGKTPGGLRFLRRMAYDDRCFAADLVDMAVRGYLRIERDKGMLTDRWRLTRLPGADASVLGDSQHAIAARLFRKGDTVELASGNASEIGSARGEQIKALMRHYKPHYFVGNGGTLLTGLLFSVAYGIAALAIARGDGIAAIAVLLGLSVAAHAVFTWLMRAPTAEGRRLLDRVEGLRLYLGVAERDELEALSGPGEPPRLDAARYEALLPYALALDVEEAWTRKFTHAVGASAAATAAAGIGWYRGPGGLADLGSLSRDLGRGLSRQISSSATPPGSSSGSGGGGFSGGGGGGGGGGGR